jgi:hypothetical protein
MMSAGDPNPGEPAARIPPGELCHVAEASGPSRKTRYGTQELALAFTEGGLPPIAFRSDERIKCKATASCRIPYFSHLCFCFYVRQDPHKILSADNSRNISTVSIFYLSAFNT